MKLLFACIAQCGAAAGRVASQAELDAEWHQRIEDQKAPTADREEELKAAEAYLARVTQFYEVNLNPRYEEYKDRVDTAREQIEGAKKTLADLQDDAHRAGVDRAYD